MSVIDNSCNRIIEDMQHCSIKEKILKSHNSRLVLYLKYENLSYKISTIQVIVIIASTLITFFETLKQQMHINDHALKVISISLSTFIAMALSVARYLKMDETKEEIYKLLQTFSSIEKKLKMIQDSPTSIDVQEKYKTFEYFNESYTLFNTILSYNENIYYRRQILNMSFENKINDIYEQKIEELDTVSIEKLNRYQRSEILDTFLRNAFGPACCFVHRYKYNDFFKEYDLAIKDNNNKLVYIHEKTIFEKCGDILYNKCNNCLDRHLNNVNNHDIENPSTEHDEDATKNEEEGTKNEEATKNEEGTKNEEATKNEEGTKKEENILISIGKLLNQSNQT